MKHALTFRGQDYAIPAGYGLCTRCDALLKIEEWLSEECPGYRNASAGTEASCSEPLT